MGAVGMGLFVGCMALLFSCLILLIPGPRNRSSSGESFEDSQKRIEKYLREMRNRGKN
jgi:hypothetical protein